jgi:hypothetical protein
MKEIDVVVTWLDGNDPAWQKQKAEYQKAASDKESENNDASRYREWGILPYLFRGIEENMPWVHKIHFVTWGHVPSWLNVHHEKIHIVRHEDFIPQQYLPLFNSNSIELNFHKIPDLAEQFVYFNDDMFVIKPTKPEDFFKNGKPCDMACLSPQPIFRSSICNIEINNLQIINDHFLIDDIKKQKWKWINLPLYQSYGLRSLLFMNFRSIIGIFVQHIPYSFLKSTYETLWDLEPEVLDQTCKNRFRTPNDVSIWLLREWQLVSGNFEARSKKFGQLLYPGDIQGVKNALFSSPYKTVCINDGTTVDDFELQRKQVQDLLHTLFPNKSSFEITDSTIEKG